MKNEDERIGIRLPSHDRRRIEQLIQEGKFENISHAVRLAVKEFLKQNTGE